MVTKSIWNSVWLNTKLWKQLLTRILSTFSGFVLCLFFTEHWFACIKGTLNITETRGTYLYFGTFNDPTPSGIPECMPVQTSDSSFSVEKPGFLSEQDWSFQLTLIATGPLVMVVNLTGVSKMSATFCVRALKFVEDVGYTRKVCAQVHWVTFMCICAARALSTAMFWYDGKRCRCADRHVWSIVCHFSASWRKSGAALSTMVLSGRCRLVLAADGARNK